ncbi:MAG: hypothetical protein MJZ69_06790 [Bacteroidaceae bacterium]|nr:hypothetical protein [Bacteroidaceae bacterium]
MKEKRSRYGVTMKVTLRVNNGSSEWLKGIQSLNTAENRKMAQDFLRAVSTVIKGELGKQTHVSAELELQPEVDAITNVAFMEF